MKVHLSQILGLLGIWLFLSCNQQAIPGPPELIGGCNTNADCASQPGTICDLLAPKGKGLGSCKTACDPNGTRCTDAQICNPISGACEANCVIQSNPNAFCQQQLPQGSSASALCVASGGTGYCALSSSSSGGCPQNFKLSGYFCKLACSGANDCSGLGSAYSCDAITNTCELGCVQGQETCSPLTYSLTSGSSTTAYAFACSPITSTCVPSCQTGNSGFGCFPSTALRKSCYVPGNPAGGAQGTCEVACTGSASCPNLKGFQCAEGACQQSCTQNSDCTANAKSGRTTCDVISGVCRTGCTASVGCATPGMACSPITSTCVQGCGTTTGAGSCLTGDARAQCYNIGTASTGTCEQGCSSGNCPTTKPEGFPNGFVCLESICQEACTTVTDCTDNNGNGRTTCDLISLVCRQGCSFSESNCGSGTTCSPLSATCVPNCCLNGCSSTREGACVSDTKSRTSCAPTGSSAPYTTGTCEVLCTSQNSHCPTPNQNLFCYYNNDIANSNNYCMISCGSGRECPVSLTCSTNGDYCQ